ncbi:unnamed protein product [Tetraodon nigroviridis]|nr:unnamed protein product [Tetraodon nigroviridis]
MRNTLLKMLAAMMCALTAYADVVPVQNFDLEKMAGKWYMSGFASNAQWFVNFKSTMKMGTAVITPTEGGDVDLSYATLNADGSCWRMTHLAKKTDTPGRFTFHSQVWNNDNDMRIADAVYNEYAVVHTIKTKEGVSQVLNKLYTRSPEVSEDLKLKFTQFSLDSGILSDNIVFFPTNAECPEA